MVAQYDLQTGMKHQLFLILMMAYRQTIQLGDMFLSLFLKKG